MNVNVCLMKQNVIQMNGEITISVSVSVKKHNVGEKDCVWNLSTYKYKNGIYLASIMDDSAIICDDADNKTNFTEKKASCKIQN